MNLIYNDVDITNSVQIIQANLYDNAGGKADSSEIIFSDTEDLWSQWKPAKGDKITLIEGGFSSGKMYIDELLQAPGVFVLKAISIKHKSKTKKTRSWENIRFLKLAQDMADSNSLILQTYNIQNYLYDRVDQTDETDLEFLNRICIREGYALKITDEKAIIYNEKQLESENSILTIHKYDVIGDYIFKSITEGIKDSCSVRYINTSGELINYTYGAPNKVDLGEFKVFEVVNSKSEAERFSKGYLRNINKFEIIGKIPIKLNLNITAGNTIDVLGFGLFDGKYFIDNAVQGFKKGMSILTIRKVLEGY